MDIDDPLNDEDEICGVDDKSINLRGFHYCDICNISFNIKKSYTRHMKYKHKNENDFVENVYPSSSEFHCEICNQTFTAHKEFCIHKLLHNQENCCTACNIKFTTDLEFQTHVNDHLKIKTYKCMECNNSFEKDGLLIKDEKTFKCDNCYKKQTELIVDASNNLICRFCHLTVGTPNNLKRHMLRTHDTDRIYKCMECEETYESKPDLYYHIINIHKPKNLFEEVLKISGPAQTFNCTECNVKLPSQRHLDLHKLLHSKNNFMCTVCNKKERNYEAFEKHILKHLEFGCKMCPKMFLKQSILNTHMRVHTKEKPFKCDKCKKSFKQSWALLYHKNTHDSTYKKLASLTCEICNGNFAHGSSLKRHIKNVHESKGIEIACNVCKEPFKNKLLLCDHVYSAHSIPSTSDSISCIICYCTFNTTDEFKNHKAVHTETFENKYMCKICNKCYYYQPDLDFHMEFDHYTQIQCPHCERICSYNKLKIHMEIRHKPETCEKCGEVFYMKNQYKMHLYNHTVPPKNQKERKPKPPPTDVPKKENFTCDMCSRVFQVKRFYDKHVKDRACKENVMICDVCNKIFTMKFKYEMHVLSHRTTKPLQCRFCPTLFFKFTSSLSYHYRKRHKDEAPYFCFTCTESFHSLMLFRKHVRMEHGIKALYATTFGKRIEIDTYDEPSKMESEVNEEDQTSISAFDESSYDVEDNKLDMLQFKVEENQVNDEDEAEVGKFDLILVKEERN